METFRSSTDDELLDVVDFDDRKIGVATRREIHIKGLIHRAIHVILVDRNKRLLLQKRSEKKDRFPGYWDISVGGHLNAGEIYLEAATRECKEEMGVEVEDPKLVTILSPTSLNGWEHIHVFCAVVDPDTINPDPEEITETRWTTLEEYQANASPDAEEELWRMTPASYQSFKEWIRVGAPGG